MSPRAQHHFHTILTLRQALERIIEAQALNAETTEIITELGLALHAAIDTLSQPSALRHAAVQALEYAIECHSVRCDSVTFWLSYAEANLRAWRQPRGQRHFLDESSRGWAQVEALCRHNGETMRADWLAECAQVSTYVGDYSSARLQLGKLMEALDESAVVERKLVALHIAMLYQHGMHQYGEAIVLLYRLATSGSLGIFSSSELFFLLARAYEQWGQALELETVSSSLNVQPEHSPQEFSVRKAASPSDAIQEAAVCHETAQRIFTKLHSVHALGLTPVHLHDHEAWLNNPVTWRWLGDKCAYAGFELFAADLYEAAARRAVGQCGRNHWFRLAKLYRRCGNNRSAREALQFARAQRTRRDAESDPQLDALESTLDADEHYGDDELSFCRGRELAWIAHLLTILPSDVNDCHKAATRIADWVRGRMQRQHAQSSKDLGKGTRCFDVGPPTSIEKELYCEAPSPASQISSLKGKVGLANSSTLPYRDVGVVDAPAPSPSAVLMLAEEDSAELARLVEEKTCMVQNFAVLSKALKTSEETFGDAVALQTYVKARADASRSRHGKAVSLAHRLQSSPVCEKNEAECTAMVTQTRDGERSIEATEKNDSNTSRLAVRLETELCEARKLIDELTSKLEATEANVEGALRAERSSGTAAIAQAKKSEKMALDAVTEARRETAIACARADSLLDHTASLNDALREMKCETTRLNKVLQARRRAFGEVVFARAVKASSGSHLMVRIVCKNCQEEDMSSNSAKFVIEAFDVDACQSYNLVMNLKRDRDGARETAKRLASRLYVDGDRVLVLGMREPQNPVAPLLSFATASAVVHQSAAVALGVLGERERQRFVLERAIAECRSVSVAARTVFDGTARATENYVSSMQNELDAAARSQALRCVSRAVEYAIGIEQALLYAGRPCRSPIQPCELEPRPLAQASVVCDIEPPVILPEKEPEKADVERIDVEQTNKQSREEVATEAEQREDTNKAEQQLSLQELDPYSPAEWRTDIAPTVENSSCRLPPLVRGRCEDETLRSLAQYKRLGYLPKSSSFDKTTVKWRAALNDCHVPSQAINSLCRYFRALPNDAIRCAVAFEGGDIEAARAKIANNPSYVRQILAVASTLDIPALLDDNSAKCVAESVPGGESAATVTKRRRSRNSRAATQRTAMGDLAGSNLRTTRSRPDLVSEIQALLEQTGQATDVLVQLKRARSRKISGQSHLPKLDHCKKPFLVQERGLSNFASHH